MMKKQLFYFLFFITCIVHAQNEFRTTWQTTTNGESITIPVSNSGTVNYTVDWGDGVTDSGITGNATHAYATAGIHTVKITGSLSQLSFGAGGDPLQIKSIEHWGTIIWNDMDYSFIGCSNLVVNATDTPNLSMVTSFKATFKQCEALGTGTSTSWDNWDVSNVSDMSLMFNGATQFNKNISNWNTNKVTDMGDMFGSCSNFNQDIGGWDTTNVTNMNGMFFLATQFNKPLNSWDTAKVTDMGYMFYGATNFNQNIGGWNVASVTDMSNMLTDVGLSVANYDALLIGWSTQTLQSNIMLDANSLKYCSLNAQTARANIISTYNWSINDAGLDAGCTALGIKNYVNDLKVTLYPNPVARDLYVRGTTKIKSVSLYSVLGKEVLSENPNKKSFSLNTNSLVRGVYVLQLKSKNKSSSYKIVKK